MHGVKNHSFSTNIDLLLRLRNPQDNDAWTQCRELYEPLINRWCRQHRIHRQDAEDIVEDVMQRLIRALPRFTYDRGKGRFRAWLKTVAKRVMSDHESSKARQPIPRDDLDTWPDTRVYARCATDLAEEVSHEMERLAMVIAQVRARVQPMTWQAFEQMFFQGQSAKEVARDLGIGVGSAYQSYYRVLQMLRQAGAQLEAEASGQTSEQGLR